MTDVSQSAPVPVIKDGFSTSEGKLTALTTVLGAVSVALGALAPVHPAVQIALIVVGAIKSIVPLLNYQAQRTDLKKASLPPFLAGNPPAEQ